MNTPALVSADWLLNNYRNDNIAILDCSMDSTVLYPDTWKSGPEEFVQAHIPGARYFDIDKTSDSTSGLPHTLPTPDAFESVMRQLGVNAGDHVIVYDNCLLRSAGRGWWMLRVMGNDKVSVLDGGLAAWRQANGPMEAGIPTPSNGDFKSNFDASLFHSKHHMISLLSSGNKQMVDARGAPRFRAEVPEPRPGLQAGHIPGAKNVPYTTLYHDDGRLKTAQELEQVFASGSIDLNAPIVTTCGSGITACNLALALFILGKQDVAVYDGSWVEWGSASDVPIETGPSKAPTP